LEDASELTEDDAFEFASSAKEIKPLPLTSPSLDDLNSKVEDS
jgi:hypothetical protein